MTWNARDVMEQRTEFLIKARLGLGSITDLCREFDISRPTGYKWLSRYEEVGSFAGIADKSRRPKMSPTRTSEECEQAVVDLRTRYGWGARKLQVLLYKQQIELPVITINRIIKRRGLIRPEEVKKTATKRYEKSRPNEMVQMDFKGQYKMKEGWCFPLTMIDDYSRYLISLQALENVRGENVRAVLIRVFEGVGVPESMLVDHGIPWWSTTNSQGLTFVSVFLIKQGVKLYFSGIRHPQTQGKVERLHRTLDEAVKHFGKPSTLAEWGEFLSRFRDDYNNTRPHEALSMEVPSKRYEPSKREYTANPREWEYPSGSHVLRLNTQGCMDYKGVRYFVCEALAHERVRIEEVDWRLVVSYRHMKIRDIDMQTGRGTGFVR